MLGSDKLNALPLHNGRIKVRNELRRTLLRREWAGHMSVLYLLHQLVENCEENLAVLRNVDWVIVPVVNPDGFVYSYERVG
jgi:murein tripeptide amidase MpaA